VLWPALIVLAAVAAVMVAVIAGDRGLAALVERQVARRLAVVGNASSAPVVRVAGAPFVTQLFGGRYREVDITLAGFTAGGLEFAGLTARLTRVRAPLAALLSGGSLVASEMTATAIVPLYALARRLPEGLTLQQRGSDLRISGLVLRMPVSGILAIKAEPRQISLIPKVVGVPALVGFVIGVPAMPPELTIRSVRVTKAGLEVIAAGGDVRIAGRNRG
jgi:LmeA-like phospholipid-binding